MAKKNKKKHNNKSKKYFKDSKVFSISKYNKEYTTDAFMNSVAILGSGTPNLLEGSEYGSLSIKRTHQT